MLLLVFIGGFMISSIKLLFIVVMKRFGCGVIGFGKIPWFILIVGFPGLVPPAPFLLCESFRTPDGSSSSVDWSVAC